MLCLYSVLGSALFSFHTTILFQSCEEGIIKLRNGVSNPQTSIFYLVNQILYPVVQGCETKDQRIVKVN